MGQFCNSCDVLNDKGRFDWIFLLFVLNCKSWVVSRFKESFLRRRYLQLGLVWIKKWLFWNDSFAEVAARLQMSSIERRWPLMPPLYEALTLSSAAQISTIFDYSCQNKICLLSFLGDLQWPILREGGKLVCLDLLPSFSYNPRPSEPIRNSVHLDLSPWFEKRIASRIRIPLTI